MAVQVKVEGKGPALRLGDAVCFVNAEGEKRGALVAELHDHDRLDLVVLGATPHEAAVRRMDNIPRKSADLEGAYYGYYVPYPPPASEGVKEYAALVQRVNELEEGLAAKLSAFADKLEAEVKRIKSITLTETSSATPEASDQVTAPEPLPAQPKSATEEAKPAKKK